MNVMTNCRSFENEADSCTVLVAIWWERSSHVDRASLDEILTISEGGDCLMHGLLVNIGSDGQQNIIQSLRRREMSPASEALQYRKEDPGLMVHAWKIFKLKKDKNFMTK
jgi:hypothetical protein